MKFEILENGKVIETRELGEGSWKIGRGQECEIRLKSPRISKQHALLVIKDGKVAVLDLGSSNGIFINGILIRKQRLNPGDEIQIVDFVIRQVNENKIRPRSSSRSPKPPPTPNFEGNAALDMGGMIGNAEPQVMNDVPDRLPPQEKFLRIIDQKVLLPYLQIIRTVDYRWVLSVIILLSLVVAVALSAALLVHWGKPLATKEALARAHTVIAQSVRENHRILSKTNDFTRLSVESCESEQGMVACFIVDPKTNNILAPAKLFNKPISAESRTTGDSDVYALVAINRILKDKEEVVSVEKNDGTYVVAQPLAIFSSDEKDRQVAAIVMAVFEVGSGITSTFEPIVEAVLVAILLSLVAYFFIQKLMSYPIEQMQEQMDAALKGDNVTISCTTKFAELENLAQVINFSMTRLRQSGGGLAQPVSATDPEADENAFLAAVTSFDEATTDGLLLLTSEKKVKYVGKVLEELLSMRSQYAVGQNISDACRDAAFAGTAIDLCDQVVGGLGETQAALLDINGVNRNLVAVSHKNPEGQVSLVLICVKMGGQ